MRMQTALGDAEEDDISKPRGIYLASPQSEGIFINQLSLYNSYTTTAR